ncbi:hypothetical protein BS17DRAFT_701438 [Gyrodon lividus]|nr:hypothetical protein BS17DRAFT_701438 [Gyrodon lividus]
MHFLFLPAYSPDLNPIEGGFLCVKSWLQLNHAYVLSEMEGRACDLYALIWEAVYTTIMPKKVYGWYRHSEYIV